MYEVCRSTTATRQRSKPSAAVQMFVEVTQRLGERSSTAWKRGAVL